MWRRLSLTALETYCDRSELAVLRRSLNMRDLEGNCEPVEMLYSLFIRFIVSVLVDIHSVILHITDGPSLSINNLASEIWDHRGVTACNGKLL